jgi:hypothetical protein
VVTAGMPAIAGAPALSPVPPLATCPALAPTRPGTAGCQQHELTKLPQYGGVYYVIASSGIANSAAVPQQSATAAAESDTMTYYQQMADESVQERASGMYRLSAFYLARTASDLPMDCTVPSVFVIMIYLMGGLRHGAYFFANWAVIMLR